MASVRFDVSEEVYFKYENKRALAAHGIPYQKLNLSLAEGQRFAVCGVDFGETVIARFGLGAGVVELVGEDDAWASLVLLFQPDEIAWKARYRQDCVEEDGSLRNRPSRILLHDALPVVNIDTGGGLQLVIIKLPRQVLDDFGLKERVGHRELNAAGSLVMPMVAFLDEILGRQSAISAVGDYFIEKLIHEMVGGVLLDGHAGQLGGDLRKAVFEQAMDYIAASAADSELTPESLASALSISLRHLQREFKRNNSSIASVIRRHRVDLAVSLLKEPKFDVLPFDKIAEYSGFSSAVQIRRTLKAASYAHPRDLRIFRQ